MKLRKLTLELVLEVPDDVDDRHLDDAVLVDPLGAFAAEGWRALVVDWSVGDPREREAAEFQRAAADAG